MAGLVIKANLSVFNPPMTAWQGLENPEGVAPS